MVVGKEAQILPRSNIIRIFTVVWSCEFLLRLVWGLVVFFGFFFYFRVFKESNLLQKEMGEKTIIGSVVKV